jgi:spermidine synthase
MKFMQSWRVRKPETDNKSVYISEKFGVRALHIGSDTVQSAMRIARPNDLEVVYTRSMMAFLLFNAEPREVLMIGLGGGSLAKFVYHHLPQARTTAIEVNPQVVEIARQYFLLPQNDARLNVMVADGVEYVARKELAADVLIVDGYDAESQVEALTTLSFYRDCAQALGDNGILVVNLWGGDRSFNACVERIGGAFGGRVLCLPAGKPGNIAAFAFKQGQGGPRWDELRRRAQLLKPRFGLAFGRFIEELAVLNPHDDERLSI